MKIPYKGILEFIQNEISELPQFSNIYPFEQKSLHKVRL